MAPEDRKKPMKILVADDDADLRSILELLLTAHDGRTVLSAGDGDTARKMLDTDDPPRLAILDWTMPGATGPDICMELRARESETSAPYTYVIILTGHDRRNDVVAGLAAGADDFITKPFDTRELERRVATGVRILEYEEKLATANAWLRNEISERERIEKERLMLERSLFQARKAEALGVLAAGIAHEINTPIQFIGDNIRFLSGAYRDMFGLLGRCEEALAAIGEGAAVNDVVSDLREHESKLDMAFLREEIPRALVQSTDGLHRVARIVAAMRHFMQDGPTRDKLDVNRAIEDAILVSRSLWKSAADVRMDLDPALPLVTCIPTEVKQTLLNLIVNAGQAVAETVTAPRPDRPFIAVSSVRNNGSILIRVSDNGPGIPEDIRDKVFDPFFTTRDVGQGLGQGLALAYASIVKKHGGTLTFETETGKGTTFTMRLPVDVTPTTDRPPLLQVDS